MAKQRSLFDRDKTELDTGINSAQTIKLYQPSQENQAKWNYIISSNFTVAKLQSIVDTFSFLLVLKKEILAIDLAGNVVIPNEVVLLQTKKSNLKKSELSEFVAYFFADIRNFDIYLKNQSEENRLLWQKIMDNYYVCYEEFFPNDQNDQSIFSYYGQAFYPYNMTSVLPASLPWFECINSDIKVECQYKSYKTGRYMYIPMWLRQTVAPLFYDKQKCELKVFDELPKEKGLMSFNAELNVFNEFTIIEGIFSQGSLGSFSNKPSAAEVKKATQQLNMKEFFTDKPAREVVSMRASMILPHYRNFMYAVRKRPSKGIENFLKNTIEEIFCYHTIIGPILFPHITGLRANMFDEMYISPILNATTKVISGVESGKWVSTSSIIDFQRWSGELCYGGLFGNPSMDRVTLKSKSSGEVIFLDDVYHTMTVPMINGLFFFLAAFGLAEVAYTEYSMQAQSLFCSVRYIRLTKLGEYAFGLSEKYIQAETDNTIPYFELDSNSLIIRSLQENNPYESLLLDTAQSIGSRRYKMSPESFLKNCTKAADVENKIAFFKQYIHSDLPPIWDLFFKDLVHRCNPLKLVSSSSYVVYKLKSNDKELQRLMVSDEVISKNVIRAEEYMILIKAGAQNEVINRLKQYGYLL